MRFIWLARFRKCEQIANAIDCNMKAIAPYTDIDLLDASKKLMKLWYKDNSLNFASDEEIKQNEI